MKQVEERSWLKSFILNDGQCYKTKIKEGRFDCLLSHIQTSEVDAGVKEGFSDDA